MNPANIPLQISQKYCNSTDRTRNHPKTENEMEFKKHIDEIEKRIGYTFRDRSLLRQAFTRTSYCNEKNYKGRENFSSNEVLEFFGDSVLSTAIISLLLKEKTERYAHGIRTELDEGDLSNIRSKLSDKRNLSRCTAELGLQKYLLLGEGDSKLMISEEASVMEDLFESIIGAVYIDCEMDIRTVIGVVSGMLDVSAYASGEAPIQSYKNALQEWCADKSRRLPAPVYKTVSESGPDHKKVYERACYIGDKVYGVGKGKNQKLADTAAAEAALAALKKEAEGSEQTPDAARALRKYATDKKIKSPEYHDLGEAPESTQTGRIYIVECLFDGIIASGSGASKNDAREAASAKILAEIAKSQKGKPTPAGAKGKKMKADTEIKAASKAPAALGTKSTPAKKPSAKAPTALGAKAAPAKKTTTKAPTSLEAKAAPAKKAAAPDIKMLGKTAKDTASKGTPASHARPQKQHKSQSSGKPDRGAKKSDKSPAPKRTPAHHTKRS